MHVWRARLHRWLAPAAERCPFSPNTITFIALVLNADQALRNSKITVQLDENRNILLTGAALTVDQARRATEVANAQAGQARVINTILPDRQGTYTPAG